MDLVLLAVRRRVALGLRLGGQVAPAAEAGAAVARPARAAARGAYGSGAGVGEVGQVAVVEAGVHAGRR